MATSNFKNSILLAISLSFFLLLLNKVNSIELLTFSFTKFVPNQANLILQGDALVTSTGKLQLTKVENGNPIPNSLGRALYAAPVRIYDTNTGNLASFTTSFTFVINSPIKENSADGIAFFLAPADTQPRQPGGLLGLFDNKNFNRSNQIVAIEFDTFFNEDWDPIGRHIGINVNSIQSIKTIPWNLANRKVANVVINYEASTKVLTASLVYPNRKTSYIVSADVDLKNVLPEWVRVGFTATTGQSQGFIETHDVLSWSFRARLTDKSGALENEANLASYTQDDSM